MSRRSTSLGLLGVALVACLLVLGWYGGFRFLRARDKPATPETAADVAHPLDPLTADEMAVAVQVLQAADKLPEGSLFPILALNEPPKEEVSKFQPGGTMRREAFAVIHDRRHNQTAEAVVDLHGKKLLSWTLVPGVQPLVTGTEAEEATNLVRLDPRWRTAMHRHGIQDLNKVYLEPWAPGPLHPPGTEGARLLRVISFYQGDAGHPYGRPIEGVVALVNMTGNKVLDVQDVGLIDLPKDSADFFDPNVVGPTRKPPTPLRIRQPDGPSFEVRGHEVRWQKWRFRYALHPREGLVLYTVGYEDDGRVRPILYRASLSEMVVPYGDPDETWAWRSPFDEGEYGLGTLTMPLRRGHEVPDNALLLDTVLAGDHGAAFDCPRVVALYEQDGGVLWTHTDPESRRVETRRSRQLVLCSVATLGNYDYGINWLFNQDGSLELRLDLSGILLAKAVRTATCAACRQEPGVDGTIRPEGEDRAGTLVAPHVVAINHQHLFCCRLDLDVDGSRNTVEEMNIHPLPAGQENPRGTAFTVDRTPLRTELAARRDLNPESRRAWRVLNPTRRTSLGHFPAYLLEPGDKVLPCFGPDTALGKRAGFVRHQLWVTHYRPTELYAAGSYPNQHPGGDGLPKWASDDEPLEDQDVVLWYTFGVTHTPRPEEWPVMPTAHTGFRLVPEGFFTRNPALDLPRPGS